MTYDGNTLTIYTNGTAAGSTTFPSATNVMGWDKTAIHPGNTNLPNNGCAPQGALMQSIFGAAVTGNGNTLTFTVPAGGQATIALAAVTDRNASNYLAVAQQQSQQANASSMNGLFQAHNQWWSNFWSKSFIQISDQQIQNNWYAALYLLACCSASNCPPPGLWGNFISSTGMAWEGDYTLDYNYQATFWGALACNHPELADNYDGLLLDHISRGQATAQHWGYQGIYLYTHLIPVPGWSDDGYTFWSQKADALFAAVNCAMRWRYTQDTNYAAEIYPYVKGVSDFWDNYLVLTNNQYVDYNDASDESWGTSDVNPATTLAFIQLVYPSLIEMSQRLNVDANRRAKWSDIVARLAPLPIVPATSIASLSALGTNYVAPGDNVIRDTSSGTAFPTPEVNVYQDHQVRGSSAGMNSTQTIFPGWDIGLESDPVTLAAALKTVYLAAEWYDGNDGCTFYPSAAAIGYNPTQILANLDAAIAYHEYPNFMFSFGGGGTEDYSIVPCTLANMFLQSYQTNLHIFPNWPANQNASFGNLNACNGFLVSSAMTNGLIRYVQITSTAGQLLKLANPWPQTTVQMTSTVNPTTQFTGNIYSYQTEVGEVVTLTPAGPAVAAPATPGALWATMGSGQITLNWYASTAATGYNLKRSTSASGSYIVIAANLATTSFTDTNVTYGTVYYYEVSATNGFGESTNSAPVSASPLPSTRLGTVVLDNGFNDANNNIGLNTNGVGHGFTTYVNAASGQDGFTYALETNSLAQLSSSVNGANRESIDSIDAFPVNAGGTLYQFSGVSFTNQLHNTGTGNTDRLLLGVQINGTAGDWIENGPAAMPGGFWIQFNSDSEALGTGNGAWADNTSVLFYVDGNGNRTELATWQFDNLRWGPSGTINYAPVLDIQLTLSATTWSLNIAGDTQGGGNPLSFSGTYAGVGITNVLLNGLNNPCLGAEDQTEAPGIIISIDRVIVKQLGQLIVTTPMFSTPGYGNNTNVVRAGDAVTLTSTVIDTYATPALQWQMADSSHPGTFTNIPNATTASLSVNTLGLGDFVPRGLQLVANDGSNSLASAVVTLTVTPANYTPQFNWSDPVNFSGLTADQILNGFPSSNKIAGAMLAQNGGSPITVTPGSGSPIVFTPVGVWATISGGNGYATGANTNQTGNANFNNVLNAFYYDGATHAITLGNLVQGRPYSVQLFALDDRSLSPAGNQRTVDWQDPANSNDVSVACSMVANAYIVGTFTASNTVTAIQENMLNSGYGNFNCLVLRSVGWNPPPYITLQPVSAGNYAGSSATLTGQATGDSTIPNPTIAYQWAAGPSGGPYTNLVEGVKYQGTTTATLTVNTLTANDSAPSYVLIASNGGGSTTSSQAVITVYNPPSQNLVGRWLAGASNFTDVSGYSPAGAHDGWLINGTAYWTNYLPPNAPPGYSLYFNNAALVISNSSTLDAGYNSTFDNTISGSFTVMCWAKGWPGGWNPWVSKFGETEAGWQLRTDGSSGGSNQYACWTVRANSTGTVMLGAAVYNNPDDLATRAIAIGADGQWHHYAGTYDQGSGLRCLYVDGNVAANETGNAAYPLASAEHLVIGGKDSSPGNTFNNYFTGNIYDVRIYSYTLSQSQVRAAARLTPSFSNQVVPGPNGGQLVLSWPFGTLLQATNVTGPWTTNAATPPYTNYMTWPRQFFRISNP